MRRASALIALSATILCGLTAAGCGSGAQAFMNAFEDYNAARMEAIHSADSDIEDERLERARRLVCDASMALYRADYELRQNPSDEDLEFLQTKIYADSIAELGRRDVDWCLINGYL